MAEKLIINARKELGWRRRLLSDGATVALWAVWIYLWLPTFRKLQEVIRLRMSLEPAAIEVFETIDPISVQHSLTALLGTCALLLLWSMLPRRTVARQLAPVTLDDCAQRFDLDSAAIAAGRSSRIAIVEFDEDGALTDIRARASATVGTDTGTPPATAADAPAPLSPVAPTAPSQPPG